MSNFDETMLNRLKKLEREVERLKVKPSHKAGMYADTYFDDLQYSLVGQKMESPSSHIVYSVTGTYVNFQKTCVYPDDYVTMNIQMSHRWKAGSDIYPHVHWIQTASAMPNLLIDYRWQTNGAENTSDFTLAPHTANVYARSSGNLNQITKFGTISPPSGAGLSDILQIRIYRDVANDSTKFSDAEVDVTVQDNTSVASFDIHFEIDQAGSDSEYTK